MKIKILTLFPQMFESVLSTSILKRAQENNKLEVELINIRDFAFNKHQQVDDYPFGGGAGMLMMIEPVVEALKANKTVKSKTILLSAQGKTFSQDKAVELSTEKELILICGHYEGIDARILNYIDEELSIGDYILTGGEIAAMVVIDSLTRLQDKVISPKSLFNESFNDYLLEAPQYTRPLEFAGKKVPDVLVSGNHQKIKEWLLKESQEITKVKRPDLYKKYQKEKRDKDVDK